MFSRVTVVAGAAPRLDSPAATHLGGCSKAEVAVQAPSRRWTARRLREAVSSSRRPRASAPCRSSRVRADPSSMERGRERAAGRPHVQGDARDGTLPRPLFLGPMMRPNPSVAGRGAFSEPTTISIPVTVSQRGQRPPLRRFHNRARQVSRMPSACAVSSYKRLLDARGESADRSAPCFRFSPKPLTVPTASSAAAFRLVGRDPGHRDCLAAGGSAPSAREHAAGSRAFSFPRCSLRPVFVISVMVYARRAPIPGPPSAGPRGEHGDSSRSTSTARAPRSYTGPEGFAPSTAEERDLPQRPRASNFRPAGAARSGGGWMRGRRREDGRQPDLRRCGTVCT